MIDATDLENEARNHAIVELVAGGLPLRTVGAEFGLSRSMVWRIAARAGVRSRQRGGIPPWPALRIAQLRQLRGEGLSLGACALRLGVSKTTVQKLVHRHEISTPRLPITRDEYDRRNHAIAARVAAGVPKCRVGAEFGLSAERIRQIVLDFATRIGALA